MSKKIHYATTTQRIKAIKEIKEINKDVDVL